MTLDKSKPVPWTCLGCPLRQVSSANEILQRLQSIFTFWLSQRDPSNISRDQTLDHDLRSTNPRSRTFLVLFPFFTLWRKQNPAFETLLIYEFIIQMMDKILKNNSIQEIPRWVPQPFGARVKPCKVKPSEQLFQSVFYLKLQAWHVHPLVHSTCYGTVLQIGVLSMFRPEERWDRGKAGQF